MKTVLNVVVLAFIALTVPSCACWQPQHRNDPGCAVLHNVVDCSVAEVQAIIPEFKPLVVQLIVEATGADGKIDWTTVEKGLAAFGLKDGGCILADIEKDFLEPALPDASPQMLALRASYISNFKTYRAQRWPGVKFLVVKKDGTKVVL